MTDPSMQTLRSLCSRVIAAGEVLWNAGSTRRAIWIEGALQLLARADTPLGRETRAALLTTTGLSEEMIEWGLTHALASIDAESLLRLDAHCTPPHPSAVRARPGQLAVVVLAGNVFSAAARGVAIPLLFGWPVIAKASSRDDTLPLMLGRALMSVDSSLGEAFRALSVASDDVDRMGVLFEQADAVSVYGSDGTILRVRGVLSATTRFIAHGHGLSAALIGRGALGDEESARKAARELALDVAAYDQRGCLSPHVAWVERGANIAPPRLLELVYEELQSLSQTHPRGPLPLDVGSAQLSWRGVAALRGTLLEGDGFAVAHEVDGVMRVSPGYRNLQILELEEGARIGPKLAPLGTHLKCLGVTGIETRALIESLPRGVAPRVCALGTMQLPPLDALADGVAPWEGLLRWIDCV